MSETTERYETETKALVTELNNLNREIHNPESTIGRIYGLLKTFSYELAEKVIPEALKACELNYLNPKVGNLCKLLTRLRDMMQSPEQLAGIGIDYLEEAVLDVLFEARETTPEAPYVQRFDIMRKIDLYSAEEQRQREIYRDAVSFAIADQIAELEADRDNPDIEWTETHENLLAALRDPTSDVYQDAAEMGIADTIAELEADKNNSDEEWTESDEEILETLKNPPPKDWNLGNWIGRCLLKKLEAAGRVEQKEAQGPWKLTDAEYQQRVG